MGPIILLTDVFKFEKKKKVSVDIYNIQLHVSQFEIAKVGHGQDL